MTMLVIAAAGFLSWLVSTIGAGGGEFLLVAAVASLLGAPAVAPVVTLSSLVAVPARTLLFRDSIDWSIVRWFAAGAIPGGILGAWLFTRIQAHWLQAAVALFLLSSPLQYGFGSRKRIFRMRLRWFLPAGFVVAFLSGLIGSMGPVLNPFYLNYRIGKEAMIGTKSFNSLVMHVAKIGTYLTLGAMNLRMAGYGLASGVAGMLAAWIAKRWLRDIPEDRFRQIVVWLMALSGAVVLWQQRALLTGVFK
jgi:uncharacterized protein